MSRMKRMKTRIDMHVHTPGSDGHGTPEQYVQACKDAGIHGLVITDHHHTVTEKGLEVYKALKAAGLFVALGCEYSTANGHCLIFGVDVAKLKLGMYPPIEEVIIKVQNAGGVAIPSHPYKGYRKKCGDKLYELNVEACETLNGQVETQTAGTYNEHAQEAAEDLHLQGTGGSDAHWYDDVGVCYTEFDAVIETPAQLIEALKSGTFRARKHSKLIKSRKRIWTAAIKKAEQQQLQTITVTEQQQTWYNVWDEADARYAGDAGKDVFFRGEEQGQDLDEDQIPWWVLEEDEQEEDTQESWFEEVERVQKALKEDDQEESR